jgi:DNA-binding MarR family transcriptional regulator
VTDPLVDTLLPTLGAVRRTLRRVAGSAVRDDALSAAEREVVLLVGRRPGRPVSEVAQELGLASNTVSTIVSRLIARGLLVRATDPDDRRIGRLSLTPTAQENADAARKRRRQVLAGALDALPPAQVEQLRAGIAALAALAVELERAGQDEQASPLQRSAHVDRARR